MFDLALVLAYGFLALTLILDGRIIALVAVTPLIWVAGMVAVFWPMEFFADISAAKAMGGNYYRARVSYNKRFMDELSKLRLPFHERFIRHLQYPPVTLQILYLRYVSKIRWPKDMVAKR